MRFLVKLQAARLSALPIHYQGSLAAAIRRILSKSKLAAATFSHEEGYRQDARLFSFSNMHCAFKPEDDRLWLLNKELSFYLGLHLPEQMSAFVIGLFQYERLFIGDAYTTASFKIKALEQLPEPEYIPEEGIFTSLLVKPVSPVALHNTSGTGFLFPEEPEFITTLNACWRQKIAETYDMATAENALLTTKIVSGGSSARFRFARIVHEDGTHSLIRGCLNFVLKVTARKHFLNLLLNTGMGAYNHEGLGFLEVIPTGSGS
ncbi:CRISPR-associated endoribonuclease Cas6 [Niabella sp.]|uniref:CRISPR-associated endoribonuclease Cas6 n=1 Tax=Niabella sp. TaxID=1962976 RepID=UPI0026398E67|nr:CRISPR-associated endoribonuclease Cas6 [Niabella sp.]